MTKLLFSSSINLDRLPKEGESLSGRGFGGDYKVDPDTGCWIWQKYKLKGYGRSSFLSLGLSTYSAHRAYYMVATGENIDGLDLHHLCKTPACVNPMHMEVCDRSSHERTHWRERVELSDEQRAEIRRAGFDWTLTAEQIAERFDVPRPTVNKLLNGYSWFSWRVLPARPCRKCRLEFVGDDRRQRYCLKCTRRPRRVR